MTTEACDDHVRFFWGSISQYIILSIGTGIGWDEYRCKFVISSVNTDTKWWASSVVRTVTFSLLPYYPSQLRISQVQWRDACGNAQLSDRDLEEAICVDIVMLLPCTDSEILTWEVLLDWTQDCLGAETKCFLECNLTLLYNLLQQRTVFWHQIH